MSRFDKPISTTSLALLLATFAPAPAAHAAGLLDPLDPCIAEKRQHRDNRTRTLSAVGRAFAGAPSEEFIGFWWQQKREKLRAQFDAELGKVIAASKGDPNAAFEAWLQEGIAEAGEAGIQGAIARDWKALGRVQRAEVVGALAGQKKDLKRSCPGDFGSQTLRVAENAATAPVRIFVGNLDGAKREKTLTDKAIRTFGGVSMRDIRKYGLLGGKGSEANRLKRKWRKTFSRLEPRKIKFKL